jgi:hypothetical protein
VARKTGLGPLGKATLGTPGEAHPIVSALQFNAYTQKYGGASMDVHTGEMLEMGSSDVVLVGGEKDTTGKRIPTTYYGKTQQGAAPKPADLTPLQVIQERRRLKTLTGNRPGSVLGSYVSPEEPHKGVQIDAAAGITDRSKVLPTLQSRNEEAGFDLKSGENIMNPYYKPKGKKK